MFSDLDLDEWSSYTNSYFFAFLSAPCEMLEYYFNTNYDRSFPYHFQRIDIASSPPAVNRFCFFSSIFSVSFFPLCLCFISSSVFLYRPLSFFSRYAAI
jgi:hypothetical protein